MFGQRISVTEEFLGLLLCGDFLPLQFQLPLRVKCLVVVGLSGLAGSGKREREKYGLPHR